MGAGQDIVYLPRPRHNTTRFAFWSSFWACVPDQVPGPPPFINTSCPKLSRGVPGACPGVSRVRVPACPGAGPVTVSRGVPGCPGVVCPGLSRPPPRDKKAFSSYLAFWGFILALDFLGSGFCLGGALAYRGSIPPGAAVTC